MRSGTPKKRSSKTETKGDRRWVISVTLLTVSILAICGGLYFYVYILGKQTYLIERNFRLLAQWSADLSRTVETYEKALDSIYQELSFCGTPHKKGNRIILRKKTKKKENGCPGRENNFESKIKDNLLEGTGISRIKVQEPNGDTDSALLTCNGRPSTQTNSKHDIQTRFTKIDVESASTLRLVYHLSCQNQAENINENKTSSITNTNDGHLIQTQATSSGGQSGMEAYRVTLQFQLDSLFNQVISRNPFDDVLWASAKGDVYFQVNPRQYHLENIQGIVTNRDRSDLDALNVLSPSSSGESDGSSSTDRPQNRYATQPEYFSTNLGGTSFEVFTQPVYFPGDQGVLVALIKTENFRNDYLAIPYRNLLTFIVIVMLLLVSWPFLRLIMMGEKDRIRSIHVAGLAGSCVVGTALITLFILSTWTYVAEKKIIEKQLRDSASQINQGFEAQLQQYINTFKVLEPSSGTTLAHDLEEDVRQIKSGTGLYPLLTSRGLGPNDPVNGSSKRPAAVIVRTEKQDLCRHTLSGDCNGAIVLAYWIDENDDLRINWAPPGEPVVRSKLSLSEREYVRQVRNDQMWKIDAKENIDTKEDTELYIQPITSWTTGWKTAVISKPIAIHPYANSTRPKTSWIAALEVRFQSIMGDPVLPPWTSFAIIHNKDGRVLFHSDSDRSLRENFLSETDHDPILESLAFSREKGYAKGYYWGDFHIFYVRPLHSAQDIPWTLVVYRNLEVVDQVNFRIAVITGIMFALYLGFGLLMIGCIWWIAKKRQNRHRGLSLWIWPSIPHAKSFELSYISTVMGILLLGACVPTTIFYAMAFEAERRPLEKYSIYQFWKDLEKGDKLSRVQRQLERPNPYQGLPKVITIGMDKARTKAQVSREVLHGIHPELLGLSLCVNWLPCSSDPQIDPRKWSKAEEAWSGGVIRRIRKSAPIEKETTHLMGFTGRIDDEESAEETPLLDWRSQDGKVGLVTHAEGEIGIAKREAPHLTTLRSKLPAPYAAWLLIVIPVFLLVRMSLRRIAFLGYEPPVLKNPELPGNEAQARASPNLIIVGLPGAGKTRLTRQKEADGAWSRIDLRSQEDHWRLHNEGPIVVLDHFEHDLGQQQADLKKQQLIERLVARDKRVLICSAINPLEVSREFWADVLQSFAVTYYWEGTEETALAKQAAPENEAALTNEREPRRGTEPSPDLRNTGKREEMERILEKECSVNRHMQELATWIRHQNGWHHVGPNRLISMIGRLAEPYYRRLWRVCSRDEKLALVHLAQDGFLHAAHPQIPGLLQKRLVVLDRGLRLMNESFQQFVLAVGREENVRAWEKEGGPSSWNLIKWPLGLALGAILLFLISTQEAFRTSVGALLSLLPVLLPALGEMSGFSRQGTTNSQ